MLDQHNLWVCKPNDFNRGRGVHIFNNLEQLKKLINDYTVGVEIVHLQSKKLSEEIQSDEPEKKPAVSILRTDVFVV